MLDEEQTEAPSVKLWSPRTIGWLTLILALIGGFHAFAGGFALAAMNCYRLGLRRKAIIHLILGPVLAVLLSTVVFLLEQDFSLRLVDLLASLVITFLVVAYLHKMTERSISRLQSGYEVQQGNLPVAVGTVIVVSLIMIVVQIGVNYGIAILQTPKVESTATLVPGGDPAIVGTIHPWAEGDGPIEGRRIVLCKPIDGTRLDPYDCTLTNFTATTDEEGRFEFDQLPVGTYLIFYDSGFAGFDAAVARLSGKAIALGDRLAVSDLDLFRDEADGSFLTFFPQGGTAEGLYWHIELTLQGGGSPFFVAHDIETGVSSDCEAPSFWEVPPGVFIPVAVKVVKGYTSQVEFDVLYRGD